LTVGSRGKAAIGAQELGAGLSAHYGTYLKHRISSRDIGTLNVTDLKELCAKLLTDGLSLKTVKNIMGGTLRAVLRDTQIEGVIKLSPFEDLPRKSWWPEIEVAGPDPFTEEDRNKICNRFYRNDRHYWPFASFDLYQSVRPSESSALEWGRVETDAEIASITKSRHLQAEDAPKTRAARRIIHLKQHVVEILRSIKPLHVKPDTPVFLNKLGGRVNANEFRKSQWYRALRLLGITARDFYSSKDTAISLDITAGENVKKVAQEAGISLATLERN
jgi:integrase